METMTPDTHSSERGAPAFDPLAYQVRAVEALTNRATELRRQRDQLTAEIKSLDALITANQKVIAKHRANGK